MLNTRGSVADGKMGARAGDPLAPLIYDSETHQSQRKSAFFKLLPPCGGLSSLSLSLQCQGSWSAAGETCFKFSPRSKHEQKTTSFLFSWLSSFSCLLLVMSEMLWNFQRKGWEAQGRLYGNEQGVFRASKTQ